MTPRVLIACEFSGVVRRAFRAIGFDAWSCDLLPAEDGDKHHIQGDVENHLEDGWHGMIAHPPCTRLTVAGARWFKGREAEQAQAIRFVEDLWFAPIPRIAIENPIGVLSTRSMLGKPTQIVQPWMFGHGETKATCFWLKRLPELKCLRSGSRPWGGSHRGSNFMACMSIGGGDDSRDLLSQHRNAGRRRRLLYRRL